jgi:serine/threonine-protein kinase
MDHLERLAEHLGQCSACETVLRGMGTDSLVRGLGEGNVPIFDTECRRLEAAAGALAVDPAATTTPGPPGTPPGAGRPEERGPPDLESYEFLDRVSRGGMGVVFRARHKALNHLVAIKTLLAGADAEPEALQRFRTEGEATARLRHPNVVQVHDFGERAGQLYFVMEFLDGGTLSQRLRQGPLPPRQAAALIATLARAVHHAHEHQILHRDLKPSNVLFAADGTPKVADFGLAKMLDETSVGQTHTGMVLGTAAYMAPEQAGGRIRDMGPAADVWALGVILYECLTRRQPFTGQGRLAILDKVQTVEPDPPSLHCRGLHPDLEAVCQKCLQKEPGQRYASALELAEDLENWLEGRPTRARPLTRWRRLGRAVRRHPRVVRDVAVAALLGGGILLAAYYRSPEARIRTVERELARGRPQTLIGEKGGPGWFRVVTEAKRAQAGAGSDGFFLVDAWSRTLVELVRDPQRDRFRLRAEVRHNKGDLQAEIGIYVAHRPYAVPAGELHHWMALFFYENRDDKKEFPAAAENPPPGNPAWVAPFVFADRPGKPFEARLPAGERLYFQPELGNGVWRALMLEVTPQGVRGFWEGREIGLLAAGDYVAATTTSRDVWRKDPQLAPFVEGFEPVFAPRGSLGLYVLQGSASFRNVVVEPLD